MNGPNDNIDTIESILGITDEDVENFEDPEVLDTYDPSLFDDVEEMVADFADDLFYSTARDDDGEYWVEETFSLDLTDEIDWDSIDYE